MGTTYVFRGCIHDELPVLTTKRHVRAGGTQGKLGLSDLDTVSLARRSPYKARWVGY